MDAVAIDGFGPLPLVRPGSVPELSDVVRRAAQVGGALYPLGGATHLGLGTPPSKQGQVVDLTALDQVIDYPARDMTITVQAGIRVARLQEILARENQRLPIDIARADQATLGGIVAANVSGSRRYGYGTLRDYVIGISAINDEGAEFKAGGRVVKNVAGYDLCKLLVGSLGTLGILTQLTLKLRPLPEERALVTLAAKPERIGGLLDQLHGSRTRPVCLDLLNPEAARIILDQAGLLIQQGEWVVVVGYEGNAAAVQWQVQELVKEIGQADALEALLGRPAEPLWHALTGWDQREMLCSFKANVLPSRTGDFCRQVAKLSPTPWLQAYAGNGIVQGHWGPEMLEAQAPTILQQWRDLAAGQGGRVIVQRCPSAWKKKLSVWGPEGGDAWVMREVKKKMDPRGLFNPGRFVVDA